jgi:sugar lactone lactonase YvrE
MKILVQSSALRSKPPRENPEFFMRNARIVFNCCLFALAQSVTSLHADDTVGDAPHGITINDTGALPENLTSCRDGTVFFGSMSKGTIYRALPGSVQADLWIEGSKADLGSVLGVLADEKSNILWVCSNPQRGGSAPDGGRTALRSFDIKTGEAIGTYPFPGGGLANDIAVAPNGCVYASDTTGGRVLRLKPGAKALEVWAIDDQLRGIDGLSFLADGTLYVNNFFNGALLRIPVNADGSAGSVTPITTSLKFSRPDGLRTSGTNTLLQVEGKGRLTEITIEDDTGRVRVIKDGLPRATGVTQLGNNALVLVEQKRAIALPMVGSSAETSPLKMEN